MVTEAANQGYDIVYASADYTLTANVEELRLIGPADLGGTGNSLNNVLVGNGGDNTLSGAAGMDLLSGGRGDDHLKGGTGGDVYLHDLYGGDDVIEETGPDADTLLLGEGISASMVRLQRRNNDLVVDLSGPHGSVTVKDWFSSSSKRVESIQFTDGTTWGVQQIRDRTQSHSGSGHDDGSHHDRDDDRDHDRDRHDSHDRDSKDKRDDKPKQDHDWNSGYLSRPARFDFEELHELLGRSGRGMEKDEIAARWRAVASHARTLGGDDGDGEGAGLPALHGGHAAQGWGFEGSVGAQRGQDGLKTLEGLLEGFRRL